MTTVVNESGVILKSNDLDYWNDRWMAGNNPWHKTVVNPLLEKHIRLIDGGKKNLRMFVPLCGKSVDMIWLADLGHNVVGVEWSSYAVELFFKENQLEYTIGIRNTLPIYQEKSGRITIYCCNILDFGKAGEGPFDAVWDKGSLGAINPEDRTRYIELLSALSASDCRYLFNVMEYDDICYNDCPYSIPMSKIVALLGDKYNVEFIEMEDALELGKQFSDQFESFVRNLFFVTRK